jgi:ATP-binding cassette subfamily C protein CydC
LGGVDLRSLDGESLRRRIGCLGQNTVLFNQTVRQNLLLANPDASQDEMESAARRAQIHERILALPDGYDTWIGERGLHLSAGERQRLAVARLLIQDPPILLLDEPSASLDAFTEAALMQTLIRKVFPGRGVLLITHRPLGLDCMDEILVLNQGRIVERGTHAALLAARGYYWRMAQITF